VPKYLISIYHPDDYDPSIAEDETMDRAIDALNDEMVAAGARLFVGGLHPAYSARSVKSQHDGSVTVSEGSHLKTREHICMLWVLHSSDLDEALVWAKKATLACRAPVEVRQFH